MLWVYIDPQWEIWIRQYQWLRKRCMEMNPSFILILWIVLKKFFFFKNLDTLYSLFSSFFFIYDLSPSFSYFVLVYLDNFWPYQVFSPCYSSWMKTSRVSSYCWGIHLDNFMSYRAFCSLLFIMNGDFQSFFLLFRLVILHQMRWC